MSGWRGTQEGREAADRIDRALGIPPGWEGKLLSGPEKTKRERALTAWYDAVDALPPEERQRGAIKASEEIITKIIKDAAYTKLLQLRERRENVVREWGPVEKLSDYNRKAYEADVANIDRQIAEQEKKVK